jgi:serine/threonine protein kinase
VTNFGLSTKATSNTNNIPVDDLIPYLDPKIFNNQNYEINKKSDVYSIGILIWQISSGYRPYYTKDIDYDRSLALAILNGRREKIVDGTPIEYSNLYQGK